MSMACVSRSMMLSMMTHLSRRNDYLLQRLEELEKLPPRMELLETQQAEELFAETAIPRKCPSVQADARETVSKLKTENSRLRTAYLELEAKHNMLKWGRRQAKTMIKERSLALVHLMGSYTIKNNELNARWEQTGRLVLHTLEALNKTSMGIARTFASQPTLDTKVLHSQLNSFAIQVLSDAQIIRSNLHKRQSDTNKATEAMCGAVTEDCAFLSQLLHTLSSDTALKHNADVNATHVEPVNEDKEGRFLVATDHQQLSKPQAEDDLAEEMDAEMHLPSSSVTSPSRRQPLAGDTLDKPPYYSETSSKKSNSTEVAQRERNNADIEPEWPAQGLTSTKGIDAAKPNGAKQVDVRIDISNVDDSGTTEVNKYVNPAIDFDFSLCKLRMGHDNSTIWPCAKDQDLKLHFGSTESRPLHLQAECRQHKNTFAQLGLNLMSIRRNHWSVKAGRFLRVKDYLGVPEVNPPGFLQCFRGNSNAANSVSTVDHLICAQFHVGGYDQLFVLKHKMPDKDDPITRMFNRIQGTNTPFLLTVWFSDHKHTRPFCQYAIPHFDYMIRMRQIPLKREKDEVGTWTYSKNQDAEWRKQTTFSTNFLAKGLQMSKVDAQTVEHEEEIQDGSRDDDTKSIVK